MPMLKSKQTSVSSMTPMSRNFLFISAMHLCSGDCFLVFLFITFLSPWGLGILTELERSPESSLPIVLLLSTWKKDCWRVLFFPRQSCTMIMDRQHIPVDLSTSVPCTDSRFAVGVFTKQIEELVILWPHRFLRSRRQLGERGSKRCDVAAEYVRAFDSPLAPLVAIQAETRLDLFDLGSLDLFLSPH